jgi:hypothetical protein
MRRAAKPLWGATRPSEARARRELRHGFLACLALRHLRQQQALGCRACRLHQICIKAAEFLKIFHHIFLPRLFPSSQAAAQSANLFNRVAMVVQRPL